MVGFDDRRGLWIAIGAFLLWGAMPLYWHVLKSVPALQILLPVTERAAAWIRKPNTAPLFGGGSALDRMLGGQVADLFVVRQYLDAQRGGKA